MFMFSNVNVYSAPISVGSLPACMEKVSEGTIFRYATGTDPKKSLSADPDTI